jgi:hypothetical protein
MLKRVVTDLKDKQLEIMALMNSWMFSRLIAENERAGESLSSEMDAVAQAEREQGKSLLLSYLRIGSPIRLSLAFFGAEHCMIAFSALPL